MKQVIIQNRHTQEVRKVERTTEGGYLRAHGWKWFWNDGGHLNAYASPWEEIGEIP